MAYFRSPDDFPLGPDSILTGALGEIVEFFDGLFLQLPLVSVLRELLNQMLPWFDPELLQEFTVFATTLQLTTKPNSSNVGFVLWSYVVEMETRPALVPLYTRLVRDFFGFIAQENNPNGLWTWLCGRHSVVREHLTRFESENPDHWIQYAYASTNYNEWVTNKVANLERTNGSSSRVDYLVLHGLAEKGLPRSAAPILVVQLIEHPLSSCFRVWKAR